MERKAEPVRKSLRLLTKQSSQSEMNVSEPDQGLLKKVAETPIVVQPGVKRLMFQKNAQLISSGSISSDNNITNIFF